MKLAFICCLIILASASRCSDSHVCEGVSSCCKSEKGKWACCPYAAGVCCEKSLCCPPGFVCSADGSQCFSDPYGFLALVGTNSAMSESVLWVEEEEKDNY